MNILKMCNLLLFTIILVFQTSLASPFESSNVNNEQLTQSWILDRFDRLENEISGLKGIIGELKQKISKYESSGSSTKGDTAEAPIKGNSVVDSSSALPVAAISGPTSCQDLVDLNTALNTNGFHIVGNPTLNRMAVVYCNFDSTPVLQTPIGSLDLKTTEVHFFVQRTTPLSASDTIIPFDFEQLNVGNAMNIRTGVFTAPVSGTYHFSFSGIKDGSANSLNIELRKNLLKVGLAYATNLSNYLGLSTINTSLKLVAGDTIALYKVGPGTLYDAPTDQFTHFTGWLEQEDLTFAPI